jgi:hypothetical protein
MLLANFAILATALFTGAAVYISLVEHPARLQRCPQRYARQIESFIAAPMLGAMASRRRAVRAARRRAKRTLENAARRERAAEAAEDDRPRVARHVDQLDHLRRRDHRGHGESGQSVRARFRALRDRNRAPGWAQPKIGSSAMARPALLVILALSACALPPALSEEEIAHRYAARCEAWGSGATSPDFEQCLMDQERLDELIYQRRLQPGRS